jgi:hypothetical protein
MKEEISNAWICLIFVAMLVSVFVKTYADGRARSRSAAMDLVHAPRLDVALWIDDLYPVSLEFGEQAAVDCEERAEVTAQ